MSKASDRAYEMLRSMIISGALAPGAQLKEEQVAELCGVSRTPVRHAIHRLEAEMFVERTESQRSFVSQWSNEDVSDLFALRALLESYAAERAAVNMSDAILSQLTACCDRIDRVIHATPPDIEGFVAENAIFHRLILEAAGSDRLSAMLRRIVLVPLVLRTALQYDARQLERSHSEHREIVAAFSVRDAEWASAIMTGHIRRAAHVYKAPHGQAPQARQQD